MKEKGEIQECRKENGVQGGLLGKEAYYGNISDDAKENDVDINLISKRVI